MRIFLDSSALVKRYVQEVGTEDLLDLCIKADEIILSEITAIEIVSALSRKKREKKLSSVNYKKILRYFAEDIKHSTIIDLNPDVVSLSIKCLQKFPTRSLDAIQIASALVASSVLFVTSDRQQSLVSRGMKLSTRLLA